MDILKDAITADTCELSYEQRKKLAESLQNWLVSNAKKKQIPDLLQRFDVMQKKFNSFSRSVKIKFTGQTRREADCGYEISCAAQDEETLRWLRYGSTWFEAHPSLIAAIIAAKI